MNVDKHFIIMCDYSLTDSKNVIGEGVVVSSVQHTREDAIKKLADLVADDRKCAEAQGWIIHEDTELEFDAGEPAFYAANHSHFYIVEVNG